MKGNLIPSTFVLILISWFSSGGCGGSGSSGFDAFSSSDPSLEELLALENGTIEQVTEQGGCADSEGTTICDSALNPEPNEADEVGIGTIMSIAITPATQSTQTCSKSSLRNECLLAVSISPTGFPQGTTFVGAARIQDSSSPWTIAESPFTESNGGPDPFVTEIRLPEVKFPSRFRIRVAVLVYFPGSILPPTGVREELLRNYRPDLVFIATDIVVDILRAPVK